MHIKVITTTIFALAIAFNASAQKYYTKDGRVQFESDAPMEKIEALNQKALCVWDTESGALEFSVLIKSFKFEKALMEEHFNENYMESEKYPKATFKGKVMNNDAIDISKDGSFTANVAGELTIHGVTQSVETDGKFVVKGNEIKGIANFAVDVADYEIEIPKLVKDNIAKEVQITVDVDLKPLDR